MDADRYYSGKELYGLKYIQFPKVLLVGEKYKHLSNDAKVAWAILKDRYELSAKNGWEEKYGNEGKTRVFFLYTNAKLMEILNIKSETTLIKIKKALENVALIEQKRVGLKTANKLYLLKPQVTENDIYQIDEMEKLPDKSEAVPEQIKNAKRNLGTPKNEIQAKMQSEHGTPKNEVQKESPSTLGTPKNEVLELQKMKSSNTSFLSTDTKLDTKKDTENLSQYEHQPKTDSDPDIEQMFKDGLHEYLPDHTFMILNKFTKTANEMEKYIGIIFRAKNKVEKDTNCTLTWEQDTDLDWTVYNTLCKCLRIINRKERTKNGKPVISSDNYLFTALTTAFYQYVKTLQQPDGGSNRPYNDWLS